MSVDEVTAVVPSDDVGLLALFRDFPDEGGQHVVERHDALDAAELVGHQPVFLKPLLHVLQGVVHALVVREILRRAHQLPQVEIGAVHLSEQVFEVHHADDVVQFVVRHGIDVVQSLVDGLPNLLVRVVDVQPHEVAAVGHDGADVAVAQIEHSLHDVLLHLLNLAFLGPFLDDGLYLLFRDAVLVGFVQPDEAQRGGSAFGQQPDEGGGYQGEQVHGTRHELGHPFRVDHPDALGHQLPEDEG